MSNAMTSNETAAITAAASKFARELIEQSETTSPRDLLLGFGAYKVQDVLSAVKQGFVLNLSARFYVASISFQRFGAGWSESELASFLAGGLEESLSGKTCPKTPITLNVQGSQIQGDLTVNAFYQSTVI